MYRMYIYIYIHIYVYYNEAFVFNIIYDETFVKRAKYCTKQLCFSKLFLLYRAHH